MLEVCLASTVREESIFWIDADESNIGSCSGPERTSKSLPAGVRS